MPATVSGLYRFPVKGLSAEEMQAVDLKLNEGMPDDRRFALAHGSTQFDRNNPVWQPKTNFLLLQRNERLAVLQTVFDSETTTLKVLRNGKQVAAGQLSQPVGRAIIEDFYSAYMGEEKRGKTRLVEMPRGSMFSDHKNPVLSFINLASVKDLERVVGEEIDPIRFRGNILIDGLAAWEEMNWTGMEVSIGTVRFQITEKIDRCGATNVNPSSGERDMNIPKALQRGYGHIYMGVYGRVVEAGQVASGDAIRNID